MFTHLINHLAQTLVCHVVNCLLRIRNTTTQQAVVGVLGQRQPWPSIADAPLDEFPSQFVLARFQKLYVMAEHQPLTRSFKHQHSVCHAIHQQSTTVNNIATQTASTEYTKKAKISFDTAMDEQPNDVQIDMCKCDSARLWSVIACLRMLL